MVEDYIDMTSGTHSLRPKVDMVSEHAEWDPVPLNIH